MLDRTTCKQAGIDINPAGKAPFSVAIGPDPFTTDGTAVQHAPFNTLSTDGEDMTFNVGGAHVADMGGSAGSAQSKNLLDVVKTLVFGMKLDVVFRLNKYGNWAGVIIDRVSGRQARLPLDQDMLPCLELKGADKLPFPSVPDSLTEVAECLAQADKVRNQRLRGRQFNTVTRHQEPSETASEEATDERPLNVSDVEELFNQFLDDKWEEDPSHSANKLTEKSRKPAPRTTKLRHTYTKESMHNVLHRDARSTAKAFKHPEVKFDPEDGSGKIKTGDQLTADDLLQFGQCDVCNVLRPVAPHKHAKGYQQFACRTCQGNSALASGRE